MKKYFFLLLILNTGIVLHSNAQKINIGFVSDYPENHEALILLKKEILTIIGNQYAIHFPKEDYLFTKNTMDLAQKSIEILYNKKDLDIIIAYGEISSGVMALRREYPIPSIATHIMNPEIQGLGTSKKVISGIPNFTYITRNDDLKQELKAFKEVYPFKKISLVLDSQVKPLIRIFDARLKLAEDSLGFTVKYYNDSVEGLENEVRKSRSEAVLLSLDIKKKDAEKIIKKFTQDKIPVFSYFYDDVIKYGALATTLPDDSESLRNKRCALDIADILEGTNASQLNVYMQLNSELTINMNTLKKLDLSPNYTTLLTANLIDSEDVNEKKYGLKEIMQIAIKNNPSLKVNQKNIDLSEKDMDLSKSKYIPNATISASQSFNDKDIARYPTAEQNLTSQESIDQLIFSEQATAGIVNSKYNLLSQREKYRTALLDLINNGAEMYFNILMAKSNYKILEQNRKLTEENLKLAKIREAVGYSGMADVYQWEANLAKSTYNMIEAYNQELASKAQLNRLLNYNVNQELHIKNINLEDSTNLMALSPLITYIQNPKSVSILLDFLQIIAERNSPELKTIFYSRSSQERLKKANNRQRYVPNINAQAKLNNQLFNSGNGSEIPMGRPNLDNTWQASINLNLPLFQGMSIQYNNQKYKIQIEQLEDQKMDALQMLRTSVKVNLQQLTVNYLNLDLSRKSANAAISAFVLIQSAYQQGQSSYVDMLNAQNNAVSSKLDESNAVYKFLYSMLNLERTINRYSFFHSDEQNTMFVESFKEYYMTHID